MKSDFRRVALVPSAFPKVIVVEMQEGVLKKMRTYDSGAGIIVKESRYLPGANLNPAQADVLASRAAVVGLV